MPKKLAVLAFIIVGLSVGVILTLGTKPTGSFLTNSLQICSSWLAAALCFLARRRGRGLSRPFWLLVGCSMAAWGVANAGWMYYENWLHIKPPRFSFVRILFDVQGVFYAMALFLDKDRDSPDFDWETLLDSVQIGLVFFSVFFGLYYVQLLQGSHPQANELVLTWIFVAINLTLTVAAAIQSVIARTRRMRSLYGGLALFLFVYTIGSGIAESPQANLLADTGSWYDLGWSIPFLVGAVWAARWKDTAELPAVPASGPKTLGSFTVSNLMLALAPLTVLVLVAQLGREWRLIGFSLLGISLLCYAARLGVTEFRHAQSANTVQMHSLAMEAAADGISIIDAKGEHVYVNTAFARMMGFENPQAMLGRPWQNIYDPRDVALLQDQIHETLGQSGKWSGQISLRRQDSSRIPIEMTITAMPQGGIVCVARDIAERLTAERVRAQTEAKYRALIEQVAAVSYIAELGLHGEWLYVSPQVETIFGYTPDEWLIQSDQWIRYVPEEDHPIIKAAEEACITGRRFQAEYRITRKDGQIIWVSDTAVVVPGSDNHPLMEGIIVDITERKALENQLQQARRMEAVGRLAGGIAHDFNNLLTIIKGYAEMALHRPQIQPELAADVQHIGNAAERASTLIKQLLAFSRKQVLQPKSLDLNAIVEGLNKLLSRLMGADIQMTAVCGANIGTVKADPVQIEQVIMNLVVNARDAMPNGGRLTIETASAELDANYARDHVSVKPGPYVMLAVSDTGIGMDPETQAHMFEPFYTTKGGGRGTGLGLSTVYGIVKQSGGYIWVYSEPGKGSTFKVYLPRVEEHVAAASAETEVSKDRKGTETILLVEDEEAVRELARMILAAQGYSVLVAESAAHAEQLAANGSREIHLLLTDVVMPGVSGRELARRLTAGNARMRVLFMSGYTDDVIAHGGVLEPGVAFLQKPFTPRVLTQKIREVLDQPVHAKR
jgi:two-component system cell cycle sensor histidine kinase/response regulator CckA